MSSTLLKLAVIAMVLVLVLHPIVECFDTWDGAGPSNDTEAVLVGIVVGIGMVLAIRCVLSAVLGGSKDKAEIIVRQDAGPGFTSRILIPTIASSPPLIPLRV